MWFIFVSDSQIHNYAYIMYNETLIFSSKSKNKCYGKFNINFDFEDPEFGIYCLNEPVKSSSLKLKDIIYDKGLLTVINLICTLSVLFFSHDLQYTCFHLVCFFVSTPPICQLGVLILCSLAP